MLFDQLPKGPNEEQRSIKNIFCYCELKIGTPSILALIDLLMQCALSFELTACTR
jgi:hypothetical protein